MNFNELTLAQTLLRNINSRLCSKFPNVKSKPIKIKRGTQLFDLHESDIRETDEGIIIE